MAEADLLALSFGFFEGFLYLLLMYSVDLERPGGLVDFSLPSSMFSCW